MTTAVTLPHHRGHRIHDLRLVVGAHPAGRLVEKQQFWAQRIGDGDVEQLALALGEAARQHAALVAQAELAEHLEGLVAHRAVVIGERGDP